MGSDQRAAEVDESDIEREVIAFVTELLEVLPNQSVEELAEELTREGLDIGERELRVLLIDRPEVFVASRRIWRLRTASDDTPPPPASAPTATPRPAVPPRPPEPRAAPNLSAEIRYGADGSPEVLERELRDRMRGRRLVAEIQLDAALLDHAHDGLEVLVGIEMTPQEVAQRYPALLTTYLVGRGVYHYSHGGFWNAMSINAIDVSWGPAFDQALRRLELETFEDMVFGDNALRYVGPILAHGGIPQYCLADYFRLLTRHLKSAADAEDLLASWRTRRTSFVGIDVPVRRFLLYGGDLAVDFIDRSIDLIKETSRTGVPPRPADVGLPPYVVAAFQKYCETDQPVLASNSSGTRLARPVIKLDPWSPSGVTMFLPAMASAGDDWAWRLHASGQFERFGASRFASREVALRPAREWSVDLIEGTQTLLDLSLEGLDDVPALFFDPRTGELIRPASGLRYQSLWVLSPTDAEIVGISPTGHEIPLELLEVLPDPSGLWSGYQLRSYGIEGLRAIGVRGGPGDRWRRLTVRPVSERPTVAAEPIPAVTAGAGTPVYASTPPVALPPGSWTVRSSVDGAPAHLRELDVTEAHLIELGVPRGCHEVDLVIRGSLGADLRTAFAVVDDLVVHRSDRLLFPGDRSGTVTVQGPQLSVDGHAAGDIVSVSIPTDGDEGWCDITDGDQRQLRLAVRVSKVLWSIGRTGTQEVQWGQHQAILRADEIGGAVSASLLVRTGTHDLPLRLELSEQGRVLQRSDDVRAAGADGRWQFDLGRFADTVARSDAPLFTLDLWVANRPVSVAKIRQTLEVTNVSATSRVVGEFTQVDLTFDEARVLDNRVARLWPLTRPWDPPIVEPIPPGQSGHIGLGGFGRIGAGHYLAEIAIDDGWTAATRPTQGDETCATVQVGTHEDMATRLTQGSDRSPFDVLEAMIVTGRVTRLLAPEDVAEIGGAAVDAATRMTRGGLDRYDASSPGFRAIQRPLTFDASALAAGVVAYAEHRRGEPIDLLPLSIEYVRELRPHETDDLPPEAARSLWELAPVLAASCDLHGPMGPERSARLAEFTGWDPAGDGFPVPGTPVTQLHIGMTAEQMRSLQFHMDLLPGQLLSLDALVAAHFEWLLAEKRTPGIAERWWRTQRGLLRPSAELSLGAADHLDARRPPPGTQEWAALPELVLRAAIEVVSDSANADVGVRALWDAVAFAPRLVTHDLVLAQVLQRTTDPAEIDEENWNA